MNSRDGRGMDRPGLGSVARARERAAAGLPREAIPPEEPQMARPSAPRQQPAGSRTGIPRDARPQAPFPLQTRNGQIGVPISKPTPAPQWPLPESIITPIESDGEPFQSPGRGPPPQRPPRPSRVPSILDASRVQDHTPVFPYRPRSVRESTGNELLPVPETPSTMSRPSTLSSVGSIPDFPLPAQASLTPSRRSVNLGPPPSARRGASSFYSNASFVSPIPEESPRSRSHLSFASSAAMPDNWGSPSPGPSPDYPDPIYGEAISEEPGYGDEDAEESRLVRNASIGKRAKPTLVTQAASRGIETADRDQRPAPQPLQGPFKDGTGYLENSSSSGTIPIAATVPIGLAMTPDTLLNAYSSASADDPSLPSSQRDTPSPNYSRFSAIRRPPRLDMEAVRKAEARGSLTSLPDLIRRATRLAASLEKGRRPASRMNDFDGLDGLPDYDYDGEKHQSGLSDMLAAFPPPAHLAPANSNGNRRSFRDSIREQVQSWPLPLNLNRTPNTSQEAVPTSNARSLGREKKRRCCGLPKWALILLAVIILIVVVAAIVIPVQLLVVRKQDNNKQAETLQQCQQQLKCANGGTNTFNQGVCTCDCPSGFTGPDCTANDNVGCAASPLTNSDGNNVVVGDAIPRLIDQAQTNFSIPLSTSDVLAKLSPENLSCSAQNALVTFDGRATRDEDSTTANANANALAAQSNDDDDETPSPDVINDAVIVDGVLYTTITIVLAPSTTFTLGRPQATNDNGGTSFSTTFTNGFATTLSVSRGSSQTKSTTTTTRHPTATSMATTTMTVSATGTNMGGIGNNPPTPSATPSSGLAIDEQGE
ncbi:hypothetical protein B0J18DRAFT_96176 [Chaetomium sp. MPI-SDFR-AT-0129]|nr:hypothetical protein B0J18DRAFT_96176 [Chaetomium sp. MPI-SDFR-AT-0129]